MQAFLTVRSLVVETYLDQNLDQAEVPLANGQSIQILVSYADLSRARKHQYAAFIVDQSCLVVWDDDPLHICDRASAIVKQMTESVMEKAKIALESTKKLDAIVEVTEVDEETGELLPQKRKTRMYNSTYVAITLALIITVIGAGARELAIEVAVDGNMMRVAFLALTPIQIFFTLVRGFHYSTQTPLTLCSSSPRSLWAVSPKCVDLPSS